MRQHKIKYLVEEILSYLLACSLGIIFFVALVVAVVAVLILVPTMFDLLFSLF